MSSIAGNPESGIFPCPDDTTKRSYMKRGRYSFMTTVTRVNSTLHNFDSRRTVPVQVLVPVRCNACLTDDRRAVSVILETLRYFCLRNGIRQWNCNSGAKAVASYMQLYIYTAKGDKQVAFRGDSVFHFSLPSSFAVESHSLILNVSLFAN